MIEEYRKACRQGKREVSASISEGRHPFLPTLDEALEGRGSAGEVPVGVREIPMDLIVGTRTRSRSNLFSRSFLPLADDTTEFASKWSDLHDAQLAEGIRDPVVVYEYLQHFYVQEGNKRVSVLRYLGAPTILASITRVMPTPSDDGVVRRYLEFVRLFHVAPVYGLVFSQEGSCELMAKLLGRDLEAPWPEEMVRDLVVTLRQFGSSFHARGGAALGATVADAFLVYLKSFATTGPLGISAREMDQRVARIWGELVVALREGGIAYIEQPTVPRGGIVPSLRSISYGFHRPKPLRIAFVYDRSPDSSGWIALHERGRLDLQRRLGDGVETTAFPGRAGDEVFEKAVAAAVADESDVIVTASPRQMDQTRRAAVAYPDRTFVNCSINLSSSAVRTFYARMYEVKFLMGALAATMAENHQVGYVATSPIYGSIAEVNAFAIGVSLVDPYATVHLKWLSAEGYDWRRELHDADVRVVAGRDYPDPQNPSEPFGLHCLHKLGSVERVATPVWDWGRYYELIVRSLQDDTWRREGDEHKGQAINYWWGMSAGVVDLRLGEGLSNGPHRLLGILRQQLVEGTVRPFDGTLVSQGGSVIRQESEARLSHEQIASMRWLNGNVVGRLPKQWELSKEGSEAVAASGVISDKTDAEED